MRSFMLRVYLTLFVVLLLVYYLLLDFMTPSRMLFNFLGSFYLIVTGSLLFLDIRNRRMIHPIQFFLVSKILLLGFGCLSFGQILGTEHESGLRVAGHFPLELLIEGLILLQLGSVAFLLGFYWKDTRYHRKKQYFDEIPFMFPRYSFLWFVVIVSWGGRLLERFVSTGSLELFFLMLPKAALFIFSMGYLQKRGKKICLFSAFMIMAVEAAWIWNSKMREDYILILFPVFFALATNFMIRRERKQSAGPEGIALRPVARIRKTKIIPRILSVFLISMTAIFFFSIVFPALTDYKTGRAESITQAIKTRTEQLTDPKRDRFRPKSYNPKPVAIGLRMAVILTSSAICVDLKNSNVQLYHKPFEIIAASVVPRFLWKNKPSMSLGQWFNRLLLDQIAAFEQSDKDETSMALTAEGEMFWAYGLAGMLGSMALLGCFIAILTEYFWHKNLQMISDIGFVMTLSLLLLKGFEASYSYSFSVILVQGIIAFLISFFLRKKRNVKLMGTSIYTGAQ